jgi:hypothetical protein
MQGCPVTPILSPGAQDGATPDGLPRPLAGEGRGEGEVGVAA